ncbi:MAG TPA: ABC-F family ATP-binding cassette domain-containing protein [Flavipsychrobacter sp.]
MIYLQDISYKHPDKELLFSDISFTINKNEKVAIVGNNGVGKSTLLKILAGNIYPDSGEIRLSHEPYFVPQHYGQYDGHSIARALGVETKIHALRQILSGSISEHYYAVLNDDWTIEERCIEALAHWGLEGVHINSKISDLSGGQRTLVFLAGIKIHQPEIVLLDEPSNHLDAVSRKILYEYIQSTDNTLVVVSHDKKLLNMLDITLELSGKGISFYGGNYDFYKQQKDIEQNALDNSLKAKEKALRKAKEVERQSIERQQKLDARGRKKQEKAGMPTIVMHTLKNSAEKSTSRIKDVHAEKIGSIKNELNGLRKNLQPADKMVFGVENSELHKGKLLVEGVEVNFGYSGIPLWREPLGVSVYSGERLVIKGPNGSGKTTLINLLLGNLVPQTGFVNISDFTHVYVDQNYSLINNDISVYEQVQLFNSASMQEHEVKIHLARLLFSPSYWDKPCGVLSGGERMRLILVCLTITRSAPDMIILDEPTNNLDIQNVEILTAAINQYRGTLMVISHDEYFLEQLGITREIHLNGP